MSHLFYRSIVKRVISHHRTLCVVSPGLGVSEVLKLLLSEYCSAHYLALVVGVPPGLSKSLTTSLAAHQLPACEMVATAEAGKKKTYNRGGVIFVGARVLAGDLLRGTIRPHLVSAMFVWDAHRLCASEYYPTCLALRATMEANDRLVIRCFSDDPQRVCKMQLQSLVKAALCSHVALVLRAQPEVNAALYSPETLIVEPSMSGNLVTIIKLMDEMICALAKKLGFQVSPGDGFKRDWMSLWYSNPSRPQRGKPVGSFLDLRDLVRLAPMVEDAVPGHFLVALNEVINSCKEASRGDWIMTQSGDELIRAAKDRCLRGERPPKWAHLSAVLSEVQSANQTVRVVVIVNDYSRQRELRAFLAGQGEAILGDSRVAAFQGVSGDGSTVRGIGAGETRKYRKIKREEMEAVAEFTLDADHPEFKLEVEILCWPRHNEEHFGMELLQNHNPRVVIVYDHPGVKFNSVLERWEGTKKARIYSLGHMDGPQVMKTRRSFQKQAVAEQSLLEQYNSLHIHDMRVSRPLSPFSGHRQRPKIIVDSREINETCQLPAKLWSEGWDVIPLMLDVGDYIVRDVVIERKTAGDLVSSLADGRIVKQCEQMQRLYSKQAIMLQCDGYQMGDILPFSSPRCNYAKFALLVKNFPKLSVLWASNVTDMSYMLRTLYATSNAELDMARATSSSRDGIRGEELRDLTPELFLARIPGVRVVQVPLLMKEAKNLGEIAQWPPGVWKKLLGAKNGQKAYSFFNTEPEFEEEEVEQRDSHRRRRHKRK